MASKNPASKRNYAKEEKYEDSPAQVKHREARNRAHAAAERKAGHAIHDDVAHIKPMAKGGLTTASNLRVESVARNRSWRKGQKGYNVPTDD